MGLGEFEPDVWLLPRAPGAPRQVIGVDELAHMDVIHGPRRASSGTYGAWLEVMQARNPRFDFTDPPFRRSLPMTLAFAATASRPTAVLSGPQQRAGTWLAPARPHPVTGAHDMVPARVGHCPLTATACMVWSGDLPRQLSKCCSTPSRASRSEPGASGRPRLSRYWSGVLAQ